MLENDSEIYTFVMITNSCDDPTQGSSSVTAAHRRFLIACTLKRVTLIFWPQCHGIRSFMQQVPKGSAVLIVV